MATTIPEHGRRALRVEHSPLAPLGFLLSMAVPAAIAIIGIAALGFDEIDWLAAIVWGVVATVAFSVLGVMGTATGMTRMDIFDTLGSWIALARTRRARTIGILMHHTNGALLAIAWAYGVALVDLPANWWTALLWGGILTALTWLMMSTIGAVHPAIRRGELEDPGFMMLNLGGMTPVGSLMGHLAYGLVLGIAYDAWPLS
jgi:hypothetical protein